jgi:hypothetical protein
MHRCACLLLVSNLWRMLGVPAMCLGCFARRAMYGAATWLRGAPLPLLQQSCSPSRIGERDRRAVKILWIIFHSAWLRGTLLLL